MWQKSRHNRDGLGGYVALIISDKETLSYLIRHHQNRHIKPPVACCGSPQPAHVSWMGWENRGSAGCGSPQPAHVSWMGWGKRGSACCGSPQPAHVSWMGWGKRGFCVLRFPATRNRGAYTQARKISLRSIVA